MKLFKYNEKGIPENWKNFKEDSEIEEKYT